MEKRQKIFVVCVAFMIASLLLQSYSAGETKPLRGMVEMEVMDIIPDTATGNPVLILEDKAHTLALPISIGINEAQAIAMELRDITPLRPMTHDLIIDILMGLKTELERVIINDLKDDTYYASIHIRLKDKELKIDSRPSDAIALAVRTNSPIYALNTLLAKAPVIRLQKEATTREIWGIEFQDLTPELARFFGIEGVYGVIVSDIKKGIEVSLKRGDLILELDNKRVANFSDIKEKAKGLHTGETVDLTIKRKGRLMHISFKVPVKK